MDFFSKFCQKNFWLVRTIVLSKFQRTLPLIGAPCGNLTRFGSFFSLDLLKSKGRPLSYTFLCLSSFFFIFFSIFFKIALPTPKPVNTQMPPNFIVKRPRIKPPPQQQVKIFFFFFFIHLHRPPLDSSLTATSLYIWHYARMSSFQRSRPLTIPPRKIILPFFRRAFSCDTQREEKEFQTVKNKN